MPPATAAASPPFQPARALLHATFVLLPLAYALLAVPRLTMLLVTAGLAVPLLVLDVARLGWPAWNRYAFILFAPLIRAREAARLTAATYTVTALLIAVWAFAPPVVAAAFLYHSVGDTAAGWIGRRYGRHRIGAKSLEGSAAFFAAATLAAAPLVGVGPAALGAAAAAAAELLLPVDDNLSVPLVGGGVVALVGRVL
jgi:dolichol kinase